MRNFSAAHACLAAPQYLAMPCLHEDRRAERQRRLRRISAQAAHKMQRRQRSHARCARLRTSPQTLTPTGAHAGSGPDVLVCNAGVGRFGLIEEISIAGGARAPAEAPQPPREPRQEVCAVWGTG